MMNQSDALKNGNSVFISDAPLPLRVIDALFLSLICVCSIVGNISLWIIVCRSRSLRTITNAFILSLSGADMLVSITNMPLTVYAIIRGTWDFSETTCIVSGYINMFTLVTSVISLCNISINRYIMVCRPTKHKSVYTKRNAAIMITGVISVSALLSSPPLYGWAQYSYIPMQHFCFCDWTKDKAYAFFMIGACFGVPFTVMAICNILIFRRVRASRMKVVPQIPVSTTTPLQAFNQAHQGFNIKLEHCCDIHSVNMNKNEDHVSDGKTIDRTKNVKCKIKLHSNIQTFLRFFKHENDRNVSRESSLKRVGMTTDYPESVSQAEPNDYTNSVTTQGAKLFLGNLQKRQKEAQEIRLTASLIVVLIIFFICWFPYCISMMLSIWHVDGVPTSFHVFTLMVGYFNSCCNPIIYGIMNKQFGAAFKRLYCDCKRKKIASPVQ